MKIIAHRISEEDEIEFSFRDQSGRKWTFDGEKYCLENSIQALRPEQIEWHCPELGGGTIECMAGNPCPKCDPTNRGPWGAVDVDIDWR